jgi:uncharacterized protein (TIGR03382 family)
MKSWVKSGARQIASGKRTFAALVLGPIVALQGCTKQEEPQTSNTQAVQVQSLRAENTATAQGAAASAMLAGQYVKTQVPIEWRTFAGTNLAQGDDTVTTVTSPFPIPYNDGVGQTSVRISMNGAISFTSTSISYINAALPSASHATFIVPFWDDLFPGPGAADNTYWGVLGTAPNREFVVEWRNVYHRDARAASNSTLNFQVVFFEGSSDVLFNYKDVTVGSGGQDKGASATVGLQVSTTSAVQHSFNQASLADNTAYLWTVLTPSQAPVVTAPTVSPAVISEGDAITVETTFTDPDGAADGPWKLSVDTEYNGNSFAQKFSSSAAAEGPASAQGTMRSSGSVNVAVRVEDKGRMRSNIEQVAVTVQDVAPTLAPVTLSAPPREGNAVMLSTSFDDPGLDSPWAVQWDFDYDGVTFDVDASTPAPNVGAVTRNQVFRFDGTFTVAARVADKDGVFSNIQTLEVTVADLSPSLTGIAGSQVLPEGATLSLQADFTNPGDNATPWKVQWDFDYDGVTFDVEEEEERNTDGRIELSRYTRDSGQPTYALRIVDADGSTSQIQVLNMDIQEAYPILSPLDAQVLSGNGDEPSSISFSLSAGSGAEEPVADPIMGYLWDFNGDGVFDYASASPYALNTYRDNARGGSYTATVRVLDEDGYSETDVQVSISNVAPALTAPATVAVEEGRLLALRLNAVDPGADALSFTVANAPEGLSITPDGLLLWTPAFKHTGGRPGKNHDITVTVTDDDGGSDSADIRLMASWRDNDNDGMADTWEAANGLDTTRDDSTADLDGDGVSNMAEFQSANGGPRLPDEAVANGPLTGDKVEAAQIVLTTRNVTDDGDLASVKYQFQLFSDMGLATKVRDVTVDQAATGTTTSATLTDGVGDPALVDLEDDRGYAWRVRATDGTMHGSWSAVQRITFNPTNDAPEAPRASQPMSGTQVSTDKPVLVVDNAVDVDDTDLTYTFELAENSALTQSKVSSAAIAGNPRGSTAWAVPTALKPFTTYYWRVIASDADGATSESEVASFTVYIGRPSNREPGMPSLAGSAQVATLTPTLEISAAADSDGDALKYIVEVDSSPSFGSPSRQVSAELEAGQDGKVRFQTAALTENMRYYFRARAMDPYSASDWAVGTFVVNAQNDAPSAPVALNPSDAIIYNKKPTLIVQNGTDPEGDAITYTFEVRNADGQVAASGENVASGSTGQTSFKLNADLEEGVEYVWVARAKDAAGAVSAASAEARFQVYKAPVIPPPAEDEGCSAGAGSMGGLLPLLVMAMGLLGRRRRNS